MADDPYRNFKFEVEIDGFARAGFSKISGLKHTIEVTEYREGGENETPRKLPGQSKFDDITMERGMSNDTDFVTWIEEVFNLDNSEGSQDNGVGDEFRRTVTIYLKNKAGARVVKWTIFRAFPMEDGSGDLDGSSNDVLIGTLMLSNEGIKKQKLAA